MDLSIQGSTSPDPASDDLRTGGCCRCCLQARSWVIGTTCGLHCLKSGVCSILQTSKPASRNEADEGQHESAYPRTLPWTQCRHGTWGTGTASLCAQASTHGMLQVHRHCMFRNVSEFAASLSRMRSGGEEGYTSVEESCGDMFRASHMTWQRSSSISVSLDIKALQIVHVGAEVLRKASFYTHGTRCSQTVGS